MASGQSWYFVKLFWNFPLVIGLIRHLLPERLKENKQNIMTERTPHSVDMVNFKRKWIHLFPPVDSDDSPLLSASVFFVVVVAKAVPYTSISRNATVRNCVLDLLANEGPGGWTVKGGGVTIPLFTGFWIQNHQKGWKSDSWSGSKAGIIAPLQGVPSARGLGLVDLNFEYSTVCPILPRLMAIWQKRLGRWARRWNTQIKVNPN